MRATVKNVSLERGDSIADIQKICQLIYQEPNDRLFSNWEMFSNLEKFTMRSLKGIRKSDITKINLNLQIATSWFLAIMNRMHINLDDAIWARFPYVCSYCGNMPCKCASIKPDKRLDIKSNLSNKPRSLSEYQKMFGLIYPINTRTLDYAGIHLAEELGEISEAFQIYSGTHLSKYFDSIVEESADFFSCLMGVFNSSGIDFEQSMLEFYKDNCHACHSLPCNCNFKIIAEFKS